jgi:nucleoside-diphosphate-sugar epimerase
MTPEAHVLVTGAAGFLGSHICRTLLDAGCRIAALVRPGTNLARLRDLRDRLFLLDSAMSEAATVLAQGGLRCVVHAAGRHRGDSVEHLETDNLKFGQEVFKAARGAGMVLFLNAGTLLPPDSGPYAQSKARFSDWLRQEAGSVQVVDLALQHIYGPEDGTSNFVPWLLGQLASNVAHIELTPGTQARDFLYVDDAGAAFAAVLAKADELPAYSRFEVGLGRGLRVRDFVVMLQDAYQQATGAASITELQFGALPPRPGEPAELLADIRPMSRLGWHPAVDPSEGLARTVAWFLGA